jgi:hypothetical protein
MIAYALTGIFLIAQGGLIHSSPTYNATGAVNAGYDVGKIEAQAKTLASHSWEYGTAAEAIVELEYPEISVFGSDPFPNGRIPLPDPAAVAYPKQHIQTNSQTLIDGDGTCFFENCGVAFLN